MAHLLSELTNDVYDLSGADFGPDPDFIGEDGVGFMLLGIFVSIIPKLVPRLIPVVTGNDISERKDTDPEGYSREVEDLFIQRFYENLEMFEGLIEKWRDNPINLSDLGLHPDSPFAKEDLVAGEPQPFQDNLLKGIRFLKYRVSRIGRKDDKIAQIADNLWHMVNVVADTIANYFSAAANNVSE